MKSDELGEVLCLLCAFFYFDNGKVHVAPGAGVTLHGALHRRQIEVTGTILFLFLPNFYCEMQLEDAPVNWILAFIW
jgi:hypothetical protein